jgi:WXXGXW repeat (2 copies)
MKKLLVLILLAAGCMVGQISIRIGPPPPPRVIRVRPVQPGPGYYWVDGYWYPVGHRYEWHNGYWSRPPYEGARWIGPRHEEGLYYNGYWEGSRGRFEHDHRWDRDRDRDWREHREHERERDRR